MAEVILWDVMDTLVRDPFFTHMPGFFGHSFEGLIKRLRRGTWVEFELGGMEEAEFYARFFADGSPIDGPGLKRCMGEAYAWIEGIERRSFTVAGAPPLRGPLFMIATVGAIVRTSVGWFEMSIP